MGWLGRQFTRLKNFAEGMAIAGQEGGTWGQIAYVFESLGAKFIDVELSPFDASILDPWSIQFQAFFEKMGKRIASATSAADLNTIKSYCCTMLNQYMWDDMNLSREGITARDNFINKTFSALDAGIHTRSLELNIPQARYWENVSTAGFNDPIYNGTLRIEVIECEHYLAGQNVQPTIPPVSNVFVPTPNVPLPTRPPVKPSRLDTVFDEYTGGIITPIKPSYTGGTQPSYTGCVSGDCFGNTPVVKPSGGFIPTKPTPIYEPIQPNALAVDAEVMDQQEEEGNFFSRNKTTISIIAALIVAKQLFSKK